MISKDLKRYSKAFLQTQKGKSVKTYAGYQDGLEPLLLFFENYYEDDGPSATLQNIEPSDIDHVLGYFVIRKFMTGADFRVRTARSIKAFFTYLAAVGVYDDLRASEIVAIARHYGSQYVRLDKLETSLWDETEGEIDRLMKLPKNERERMVARLRVAAKDAVMKEAGYVKVEKIDGNFVYGHLMDDQAAEIGPIRLGEKSLALVRVGDIINMITLRQMPKDTAWEIVELGYVYPRPYENALSAKSQ